MSESFEPVRSYQRIFRPERRIYQIEGHPLPVPGGVPLRWLAYAIAALLAVVAAESGSAAVVLFAAALAAIGGFGLGGREGAAAAALLAAAAIWLAGLLLGLLDWPLRLVVIPAAVATLGTQATPDGRRAERFALSWLALRLTPPRRSLGRTVPAAGRGHSTGDALWIEADERLPELRRCRVRGPALVFFSAPLAVRRVRRRLLLAQPPRRRSGGEKARAQRVVLGEGEALEVRP